MSEQSKIAWTDAVLQECELCHNEYSLRDVEMTDSGQILCKKCRAAAQHNEFIKAAMNL